MSRFAKRNSVLMFVFDLAFNQQTRLPDQPQLGVPAADQPFGDVDFAVVVGSDAVESVDQVLIFVGDDHVECSPISLGRTTSES